MSTVAPETKNVQTQVPELSENGTEIDLVELMYRLLDKIWYIIIAAVVGALIAAVWTFNFVTPLYTATAKLYVLNANDSVVNLSDLQIGTYLAADYQEVFSNWHVHEMVNRNLKLDYPYSKLNKMVSVSNPTGTRILYVKVTSSSPTEAKMMADEYTKVAQEFIALKMETKEPNVFEEALLPTVPSSPSKTRNILIGFLLGLVLSAGVITLQFVMDDRIRTAEDIEKYFSLPTLGIMPKMKESAQKTAEQRQKRKSSEKSRRKPG